ncbi:acyltransferase-like protein 3 [Dermatophagoides farinae]|uniref:Acyltransferase-like protein 3 n=1 Tax=Dermatophagoides farinae TaxID=6954 RepID=A0A9D4SDE5_DERFA|nr:acyltransferase-like protein 3 [Dermatophagoides farinae]
MIHLNLIDKHYVSMDHKYRYYYHHESGFRFRFRFYILLLISLTLPQYCSTNDAIIINHSEFLWRPLFNVSNDFFAQAILPITFIDNQKFFSQNNLTSTCQNDLRKAIESTLHLREIWSIKLFNSWSKSVIPAGMFMGTLTDYGDYDQCMSIIDDQKSNQSLIIPQYCLIDMAIPMPKPRPTPHNYYHHTEGILPTKDFLDKIIELDLIGHHNSSSSTIIKQMVLAPNPTIYEYLAQVSSNFYYSFIRRGICLPSSCTTEDVHTIIKKNFGQEFGWRLNTVSCTTKSLKKWWPNLLQKFAIFIISSLLIITFIAAIYDQMSSKKNKTISRVILMWFSPISNTKKLLFSNTDDENFNCIHGLKFLSISWIIVVHTLAWIDLNGFRNSFRMKIFLSTLYFQPLFKGFFAVETFFYLSGLLTSYSAMKYTRGDYKNLNKTTYMLLRYFRLTPQLILFMLLLTLFPPMFDGPIWSQLMTTISNQCSKTWWHNLIYLQNLIDIDNMCGLHTWYLAADMQLHWFSLFPIIWIIKNPRNGLLLTKFLIIIFIFITGFHIYFKNLPPGGIVTTQSDMLEEDRTPGAFTDIFFKPWSNAYVFFAGFLFGFHLYDSKLVHSFFWTKTKIVACWLLIIYSYLFCIYSTIPWVYGQPYNRIWSSILYPLNRIVWSIMLTLLIFMCITRPQSMIARILSWKAFRPFSRMTFSVYLTHALVLYVALGSRHNLIDLSITSLTFLCFSTLLSSYAFGSVFTILFESPIINLFGYVKHDLLRQLQRQQYLNNKNNNDDNDQKKQMPITNNGTNTSNV